MSHSATRSIAIIACGVIAGIVGLIALGLFVAFVGGFWHTTNKIAVTPIPRAISILSHADQGLIDALDTGDIDQVKSALQDEPNLNLVDPKLLETPLAEVIRQVDDHDNPSKYGSEPDKAVLAAWRNLAEGFVKAGANVDGAGLGGEAPLLVASTEWSVTFLLSHGAKVDIDVASGTPLYWCSTHSANDTYDWNYQKAKILLAHGADPNIQNEGKTPLHRAAATNARSMIGLLLQSKAEINKRDNKGYTPLKRAQMSFQNDAAELLQGNGGTD